MAFNAAEGEARRRRIAQLGVQLAEAAAQIDVLQHRLLTDIREFDETGGWASAGARSCAHYLSWRIGLSPGTAREKVRVAKALAHLPLIDDALAHGLISYSKARAITRVADPECEASLLNVARCSPAAILEKICRRFRGIKQQAATTSAEVREREERRSLTMRLTDDDMVTISATLAPDEAAIVVRAIESLAAKQPGSRPDALVELADRHLRGDEASKRTPIDVVVHIQAETLEGTLEAPDCGVSAEVARRLCCDAGIVPLVEGTRDGASGQPLAVGRKTRSVPQGLKRALASRDDGCCFPGCENRYVDAHHVHHWLNGGETRLDNLISVCRTHHTYLHDYGFTVELSDAGPVFRNPEGQVIGATFERPLPPRQLWPIVDPHAQIPVGWTGRADHDWILGVLTHNWNLARNRRAAKDAVRAPADA